MTKAEHIMEKVAGNAVSKWWAGRHDRRNQRKLNREGRRAKRAQKWTGKNYGGYVSQPAQSSKPAEAGAAAKPVDTVSYKKSGTDFQQQAKKTDALTGKTTAISEKTKGGDYGVYGKQSQKAKDFNSAFAAAKKDPAAQKAGKFSWNNKEYSTKMASAVPSSFFAEIHTLAGGTEKDAGLKD